MTYTSGWSTQANGTHAASAAALSFTMPMTTEPYIAGRGPAECSSCTELSVVPAYIHDVNGYYRDLGVPTDATRKQMRLAYFERDGQSSDRLTYVMKQLLNPQIRAEYDALQLGQIYIDKYVEAELMRRARAEHDRRMRARMEAGLVVNEGVEKESMMDIFRRMGAPISFDDQTGDDTPGDVVDGSVITKDDDLHPAKEPFSYSFYLWRTRLSGSQQLDVLATWQEHLVGAFSRRGVRQKFAVGLHGGMAHPYVPARVGYREVFFLHHLESPTTALAERAVDEWLGSRSIPPPR